VLTILSRSMASLTALFPYAALALTDLGGADEIAGVSSDLSDSGIREAILNILFRVLSFVGLIAVVVIVIAGIMLVISGGDEQQKDKAKKIIIYTIVGMLVIGFASAFVGFVASLFD
jgi:hypothetical protein